MAKHINPAFGWFLARIRKDLLVKVDRTPGQGFGWTIRRRAEYTQEEFAKASGIPLGTIREVEQGKREPGFATMQKWVKALQEMGADVTLDDLPDVLGSERGRDHPGLFNV